MLKRFYKGIYICVQTPICRLFEFDTHKHNGLFKYCGFSVNSFLRKELWYMHKDLTKKQLTFDFWRDYDGCTV